MVVIGNILVIAMALYYIGYFTNLFVFGRHRELYQANVALEKLRKKTIKTLEDQKTFLNIKYPKPVKSKWTMNKILFIIGFIVYIVLVAIGINIIFKHYNIQINFWIALFIVSISPFLINAFLSLWKLDSNDLFSMIKKK